MTNFKNKFERYPWNRSKNKKEIKCVIGCELNSFYKKNCLFCVLLQRKKNFTIFDFTVKGFLNKSLILKLKF